MASSNSVTWPALVECNGRCHAWGLHQPGQGYLGGGSLLAVGHGIDSGKQVEALFIQVFLADAGPTRAFLQVGLVAVLAGEEAGGEAVIRNRADVFLQQERGEVLLEILPVV